MDISNVNCNASYSNIAKKQDVAFTSLRKVNVKGFKYNSDEVVQLLQAFKENKCVDNFLKTHDADVTFKKIEDPFGSELCEFVMTVFNPGKVIKKDNKVSKFLRNLYADISGNTDTIKRTSSIRGLCSYLKGERISLNQSNIKEYAEGLRSVSSLRDLERISTVNEDLEKLVERNSDEVLEAGKSKVNSLIKSMKNN